MCEPRGYSIDGLAELFAVSRPTVYRTLRRQEAQAAFSHAG